MIKRISINSDGESLKNKKENEERELKPTLKVSENEICDAFIKVFYEKSYLTESECAFMRNKLYEGRDSLI